MYLSFLAPSLLWNALCDPWEFGTNIFQLMYPTNNAPFSDIPQEWNDLWANATTIPELRLQERNQYISTDFTIFAGHDAADAALIPLFPERIIENEISELWYRQDSKFNLPMSLMYFYFISPLPMHDPQWYVMCDDKLVD